VIGGPSESDWNRNCGESSKERVVTGNQRMRRGWLSDGCKCSQEIRNDKERTGGGE